MPREDSLAGRPEMGLLEAAVPLWMNLVRTWPDEQRMARAAACGSHIAAHGDDLLFGGKTGAAAGAFNALAEGLACLALAPGGVTFAGLHFCDDHAECTAPLPPAPDDEQEPQRRPVEDVPAGGLL